VREVEPVLGIAMVAAWWRDAIATLLLIAIFAAGAIAGFWTIPSRTQ